MAKSKFTTTLDTELLKQAKIEAIQLDMSVAEFLEKLIKEYFEGKDKEYSLSSLKGTLEDLINQIEVAVYHQIIY